MGGKILTNYLKELVSFRQWNVMDETLLMNQVYWKPLYQPDTFVCFIIYYIYTE